MKYLILIFLLLLSFSIGITDIFKSKAVAELGSFTTGIISRGFSVILFLSLFAFIYFYNKPLGPIYIPKSIDSNTILLCFFNGLGLLFSTLFIGSAFYYNKKLKTPINVGVLTSIITLSFLFEYVLTDIINYINNKPLNFTYMHLVGIIFLVIGVLILSI